MFPLATTPAWLPLAVSLLLVGVLVFLYLNMQRNLRRIDFDDGSQAPAEPTATAAPTASTDSASPSEES